MLFNIENTKCLVMSKEPIKEIVWKNQYLNMERKVYKKLWHTKHALYDREENEDIRIQCGTQDIRWVRQRRRLWTKHVKDRFVINAKVNNPEGQRPPKRWRECLTLSSG